MARTAKGERIGRWMRVRRVQRVRKGGGGREGMLGIRRVSHPGEVCIRTFSKPGVNDVCAEATGPLIGHPGGKMGKTLDNKCCPLTDGEFFFIT